MKKIIVIGGGPAGMIAAIASANKGHQVDLFEKNNKLGKKLYITGKGRCNLTNACDKESFFEHICSNTKFLFSSYNQFNNMDTIQFFNKIGLHTKIERGNRVFPTSDKSSDVIKCLKSKLEELSVGIHYDSEVEDLIIQDNKVIGIKVNHQNIFSDVVIVATGGVSYPVTGSTGDGYRFAKNCGHHISDLSPSLVPIYIKDKEINELMGLSLKNIGLKVIGNNKKIYEDFGEMLFTHFGISGPLILSTSSYIIPYLKKGMEISIVIDLKPALTEEQLDHRILRDFEEAKNKKFKNSLDQLLPSKLIDFIIKLSEIDADKKVNEISKIERKKLLHLLKNLTFKVDKLADYNQAVITKGGINVKEINPTTMESKKIKDLYFIGEVLDLDALTGGFNLQIAWSTGYVAGNSI